jgi:hypothetical protein
MTIRLRNRIKRNFGKKLYRINRSRMKQELKKKKKNLKLLRVMHGGYIAITGQHVCLHLQSSVICNVFAKVATWVTIHFLTVNDNQISFCHLEYSNYYG